MDQRKSFFTIGNIISETINFYSNNFLSMWLPYILIVVPVNFLVEYIKIKFLPGFLASSLTTLLTSAISAAVALFVIISALSIYKGSKVSWDDNIDEMRELLFSYILLQILMFLGIVGGSILLFVPGLIFSLWWAVSSIVLIEEGLGVQESMKRSRFLTNGFKGEILVVYIVIVVIGIGGYLIFSLITSTLIGGFQGFFNTLTVMSTNPLSLSSIIYSTISSLLLPFYPLLSFIIYFNLKKEKEGYATEELAESFLDNNSQDETP